MQGDVKVQEAGKDRSGQVLNVFFHSNYEKN